MKFDNTDITEVSSVKALSLRGNPETVKSQTIAITKWHLCMVTQLEGTYTLLLKMRICKIIIIIIIIIN